MEGYLLMWEESGDEIHIDLISPDDAQKFTEALGNTDAIYKIVYAPLIHWFTQTHCAEPWPFQHCNILGTICVPLGG